VRIVILYILLAVCGAPLASPDEQPNNTNLKLHDELDIMEAVFRYQFKQYWTASAYCLSSKIHQDSFQDLLKRFRGNQPPVKDSSGCFISQTPPAKGAPENDLVDKETGLPALGFRIDEIVWKSAEEVEVTGGYSENSFSADEGLYYVVKRNGKWVVKRYKGLWIA
jgi:hypothetical protein